MHEKRLIYRGACSAPLQTVEYISVCMDHIDEKAMAAYLSKTDRMCYSTCACAERARRRPGAVVVSLPSCVCVCRLTTRRNVYDVFKRPLRANTARPSDHSDSRAMPAIRRVRARHCPFRSQSAHAANLFRRHVLCPSGVVCGRSQALSPNRVARLRQTRPDVAA